MTEPAFELDSRRAIYQQIVATPGIHFRELFESLSYAEGTLQYHLRRLVDEGLVEDSDDGKYTRYYPTGEFDEVDRTAMNALRRQYSRRILAHLLTDGPLSTGELSNRLEKAPSTVSWHLSNLVETDLLSKEREGRSVVYEVSDPKRVRRLYTTHQRSFTDRVVDRLLDLWETQ